MSDTGLSDNDITYETHVADDEQQPEPKPEEPEEPASNKQQLEPEQPEPEPVRAPISWLRQVAAEIEAKKGNPNPGRTRQSRDDVLASARPPHTMSESTTGKLNQKDYTPEVDELLPQATLLAQVRFPHLRTKVPIFKPIALPYLGWTAP
jgi:hypothetical protein